MLDLTYTDVPYAELDSWIVANMTEAKDYNINITGDIPPEDLYGAEEPYNQSSNFGLKFKDVSDANDKFINLKLNIKDNVTKMTNCFKDMTCLKTIKLEGMKNVLEASYMLDYAINLIEADFAKNNIEKIACMFYRCSKIETIDLRSFKNLKYINRVCGYCDALKTFIFPENISSIDHNNANDIFGETNKEKFNIINSFCKTEADKQYIVNNIITADISNSLNFAYEMIKTDRSLYYSYKNVSEYILKKKGVALPKILNISEDSTKLGGIDSSRYSKSNINVFTNNDPNYKTGIIGNMWYNSAEKAIYIYDDMALDTGTEIKLKVIGNKKFGKIPIGTYSQEDFWRRLSDLVPRGTYRECKGTFNVTVEGHTISQTNGYIVSSDFYSRPTVALFKNDNTKKYHGYSVEDVSRFAETRAYVCEYDETRPIGNKDGNIGKSYNYPIEISVGDIIFI